MSNDNKLEVDVVTEEPLAKRFSEVRFSPNKISHLFNGTTTLAWHVDDDDDRYVQVTDSVAKPTSYLVVSRDGKQARACLASSFAELFGIVSDWTTTLHLESKSRG